jgi:hypothetical protein
MLNALGLEDKPHANDGEIHDAYVAKTKKWGEKVREEDSY